MSNTTTIYTTYQPDGSPVVAIQDSEKDRVAFAGVVNKARFFSISTADRLKDLMTRAINNRTRERNYFKLYCDMLDGNITEEEFDKEIEQNEDKYIIKQDHDASTEDIEVALEVSPSIMDVKSPDDMAEIFSFSLKSATI